MTQLNDKIEAYEDLLKNTLATEWKVEPFYLDKIRWNIAIFYEEDTSSFVHADTNKLAAKAAADIVLNGRGGESCIYELYLILKEKTKEAE